MALASVLEQEAARLNRTIGVLAEFNLAGESTKTGMDPILAYPFFEALKEFKHLIPEGIMVMGPHVEDEAQIAAVFREARMLFDRTRVRMDIDQFRICSMGMSHDYPIALREGSTQLRLGSILFPEESVS